MDKHPHSDAVVIEDLLQQNKQLSHSCQVKQKELDRLNKHLSQLGTEEEKRVLRQAEVFQQFKKRAARVHNALDVKLLDVIDSYERQLAELRQQLRNKTRCEGRDGEDDHEEFPASQEYKSILQSYKNQVRDEEKKVKNLKEKLRATTLDLQGRPTLKDLRQSQQRVYEMEKAMSRQHISGSAESGDCSSGHVTHSRHIDDVHALPVSLCRRYLEDVASALKLHDMDGMTKEIHRQRDLVDEMSAYFEFAKDMTEMVEGHSGGKLSLEEVMGVVRQWRDGVEPVRRAQELKYSEMSRVIEHIQKLFDVSESDMAGLYPAMNRVYTRCGEMTNVLRTLRDTLGLSSNAKCHTIVDAVDVLKLSNENHLRQLLHTDDLSSVLQKLEEHASFMPTFQTVIERLMDLARRPPSCPPSASSYMHPHARDIDSMSTHNTDLDTLRAWPYAHDVTYISGHYPHPHTTCLHSLHIA